jgi:hypothetical protein
MQIDKRVEAQVREAFSGAIGQDGDRMVAAIQQLNETDAVRAAQLGVFAVGFVMKHAFGDSPTAEDAQETARDIIEWASSWVELGTPDEVANFLLSAARADISFPGVPNEDLVGLTFVCGGYLLATRRLKDQRWYEYLDEIWNMLEAMPEPA